MKTISQKKSIELGELYRELRVARGLKLKDVAKDNLSISQLSKFENGQTMLSADRLLLAIKGIHMDFAEFGYALNDYKVSSDFKMDSEIAELFFDRDIGGLKYLLDKYRDSEVYDTYNQLNLLIIKDCIYSLDPSYKIDPSEIEFLTQYLYDIEEWTGYELYVFGNTVTLLSDQDLIFLGKALVERAKSYASILSYQVVFQGTLLNLIGVMIERKLFYYTGYFIDTLKNFLTPRDLGATVTLTFLELVIDYLQSEEKNRQVVDDYITTVGALGDDEFTDFLKTQWDKFLDIEDKKG